jgi:hypothetical protein
VRGFSHSLYVSDLVLEGGLPPLIERAGSLALGVFVRSGTFLHFPDDASVTDALGDAGFDGAVLLTPRGAGSAASLRVVHAWNRSPKEG